jgi:hypothetical protein
VLQPHHENLCQHGDLRYATPERYFLLAGAICFSRVRNYLCVSCSAIRSIGFRRTLRLRVDQPRHDTALMRFNGRMTSGPQFYY